MSVHVVSQMMFDFSPSRPIVVDAVEEQLTSDAGLLIFRQWDQRLGLTAGFADCIADSRRSPEHSILEMIRSRVFGVIAGYEDQNDHSALRADPMFKMIADRSPDDESLASQPTLSRFENAVTPRSLLALEEWFIQRFVESFDAPPHEVTLDIDVFDDPAHGDQQLTFFHGYYNQYQYLVRAITCAENDQVALPALLHGTADVALGLERDLERIIEALRAEYPDVLIRIRADSGYAKPWLYRWCERNRVEYTVGIGMNRTLQRNSEDCLQEALDLYENTGESQRLFTYFEYQAGSWSQPRFVAVKCEVNSRGTNRRAVVSNRPGGRVLPEATYDEYADRGEAENRNKELKCELHADRLSDHRYMANCFRMFLHCVANNLLVSLRREIAAPPPDVAGADPPPEALQGAARRRRFNHRRQADPLGEGHACTWRLRLIKVAARIKVTARRVRVFLSSAWPFLHHFRDVAAALSPG